MVTASDADNFVNTIKYPIYFFAQFHYNLLKASCAKGNSVHLPDRPENGLQADSHQSVFGGL
jgi:hypothetical protein